MDKTRVTATAQQVLDLIAKRWDDTRGVYPGMDEWLIRRDLWASRSQLDSEVYRERLTIPLSLLRAMAKRGMLVEEGTGRGTRFTTPKLFAAIAAERALTPEQRGERSAKSIEAMYERNFRGSGDNVWKWPVDTGLMGVVSDGVAMAVEMGLVRRVKVKSQGTRFVPEDKADAWQQAYDDEEAREQRRHDYVKGLGRKLDELLPPTGERYAYHLSVDQLELVIQTIEHHRAIQEVRA